MNFPQLPDSYLRYGFLYGNDMSLLITGYNHGFGLVTVLQTKIKEIGILRNFA